MLTRRHKDEGAGARDAHPLFANNSGSDSDGELSAVKRLAKVTVRLALLGIRLELLSAGGNLAFSSTLMLALRDPQAAEQLGSGVAP